MRGLAGARWSWVVTAAAVWLTGCQAPGVSGPGGGTPAAQSPLGAGETLNRDDLDVRLESVAAARPAVESGSRNPFEFGLPELPVEVEEPSETAAPEWVPAVSGGFPSGQPVVRLEFIGLVEAPDSVGLIAVLTDGEAVFHGREGDTVEGRYRLDRIEPTTIEVVALSDDSRHVLRLAEP